MCEYLKDPDTWVSLIALITSIIALFQTSKQAKLSNKQSLFDRRVSNCWIINGLFKLYAANGEMLESADWNKPYYGIQASFLFITNNEFLENMEEAFGNPFDFNAKRTFLSKCEYIQRVAEEVPLLFEGAHVESIKKFIEVYKNVLIAMFRYRIIEKEAERNGLLLSDDSCKIPENRYRKELHIAVNELKKSYALVESSSSNKYLIGQIQLS